MTSVLYRAKRKDTLKWVEGYYAKVKDYLTGEDVHVIFPQNATRYPHGEFDSHVEIIPETLCRLLDWACYDGYHEVKRLFQNDILAVWERNADVENTPPYAIAIALDETRISEGGFGRWFPQDTTRIRIIGNAYDNPELLSERDMNHFITRLHEYPGTPEEYSEQHRYLMDKYKIRGMHACCYMCNFDNEYVCHQYNGGCHWIGVCRNIQEQESECRED